MFSDQEFQEVMQKIKNNNEQKKEFISSNKDLHQLKKNLKQQIDLMGEKIKQLNAQFYLNKTWKEDKLSAIYKKKLEDYNKFQKDCETNPSLKDQIPGK